MEARSLGGFAVGLGCTALLFVAGVMTSFAGATTCHEDVQSADQAPHLCTTAGNSVALSISAVDMRWPLTLRTSSTRPMTLM